MSRWKRCFTCIYIYIPTHQHLLSGSEISTIRPAEPSSSLVEYQQIQLHCTGCTQALDKAIDKNSCCVAPALAWSTYVANRDSALPKNNSIHPVFLKVILNAILHGAQLSSVFLIDFWGNVGPFK